MARYFAQDWDDILVAIPVNPNAIDTINSLAENINLHICVERKETLTKLINQIKFPTGIYIEVDSGYGRTGIETHHIEYISEIAYLITRQKHIVKT